MLITRWWLDADGAAHTEQTQWVESSDGAVLEIPGLASVSDAVDPSALVVLVTISGSAVAGLVDPLLPGYFDLALKPGATIVDEATFQVALDAGMVATDSIDQQIADYLAAGVDPDVTSMLNKIAAVCSLTTDEKTLLTARLS